MQGVTGNQVKYLLHSKGGDALGGNLILRDWGATCKQESTKKNEREKS